MTAGRKTKASGTDNPDEAASGVRGTAGKSKAAPSDKIMQTLYDLQTRLIELETQNEELLQMQAELAAERSRYFDLYDAAPVGYITLNRSGVILEANLTAAILLGIAEGRMVNQPISNFIIPEEQASYCLHREKIFESGQPQTCELRLVRLDGTIFWAHLDATVAKDTDGTIVCRIVLSDITERKQAEAEHERLEGELRQAQKLEAVGQLAGGVAHDFNNLLMSIMCYAELCRDELPPEHPIREWLGEIISDTQRSAAITRQLLTFARKQPVSPKVLDLNEAVANILKLLRRLLGERIQLVLMPGANLWQIKIDSSQIDQILVNLCVNSRDAIVGTGKVVIETANVHLNESFCINHTGAVPGAYVLLSVSDDGCGMEKNILNHIFDPFFTTKGLGKGTGLGLSTVYGIVKQNGGFITVCSEPGKGATFRIYLPLFTGHTVEMSTAPTGEPASGHGETVLLVEDEASVRAAFALMLKALGYNVLVAETPAEALKIASRQTEIIHLLLTDIVMPEMDGRQLAMRIQQIKPGIKILLMSGYTENETHLHDIPGEEVPLIVKPFSRDEIARRMREVLGK